MLSRIGPGAQGKAFSPKLARGDAEQAVEVPGANLTTRLLGGHSLLALAT